MSHLWDLIQAHLDEYGVRDAAFARRMGTSAQTLNSWKNRGLKRLPERELLEAVARETRVPYEDVLDAVLIDINYKDEEVGRHGDAAPMTPAGESPAAEGATVHEFPGSGRLNEPMSEEEATVPDKAVAHEGGHYDVEVQAFQEEP